LDQPERERKQHALEENDDANPETQLLCSDTHCDLVQVVIGFRRPWKLSLSSRLAMYQWDLRPLRAANTISQQAGGSFRLYSGSLLVFFEEGLPNKS
jgi:hypothetical protein